MTNVINIILIIMIALVFILRCYNTEKFDHVVKCNAPVYGPNYPYTKDNIFDGVSLYKKFNIGGNSQLASIYYTPETIPNGLKNRPNTNDTISAVNEGDAVFSDRPAGVNKQTCQACNYTKAIAACDKNVSIGEKDHCPKLLTCSGSVPMSNSVSYKKIKFMNDGAINERGQLDLMSQLANKNSDYTKNKTEECCELNHPNNHVMRAKFKEFLIMYLALKKYEMTESIDAQNIGAVEMIPDDNKEWDNIHWDSIKIFLNNTENKTLFNLPANASLENRFYIMLKLITKYTDCSNPLYRKC
jgi:hypothetical protein